MLRRRLTAASHYLALLALAVAISTLLGCGDDTDVDVAQVAVSPTIAPATATLATPTARVPLPTIVPATTIPPTETPYWAKTVSPETVMELYPPVSSRTDYELKNTQEWLNGEPTTIAAIRDSGKVVLVDFWTYT